MDSKLTSHVKYLIKPIKRRYQKVQFITEMANVYAFSRNRNTALKLAEYALELSGPIKNNTEKSWALTRVAKIYSEFKKKSKVSELLSQSLKYAMKIKKGFESQKNWCLHHIAALYTKFGFRDKAYDAINKIDDICMKADAFVTIADNLICINRFGTYEKEASDAISHSLEIVNKCKRHDERVWILSKILKFYSEHRPMFNRRTKKQLMDFYKKIDADNF